MIECEQPTMASGLTQHYVFRMMHLCFCCTVSLRIGADVCLSECVCVCKFGDFQWFIQFKHDKESERVGDVFCCPSAGTPQDFICSLTSV